MHIRQLRGGIVYDELGGLPVFIEQPGYVYLTTTAIVKYNYEIYQNNQSEQKRLVSITVVGLPNGMLQERYNPDHNDDIWLAGRNAPTRGEDFRVRVGFEKLKRKANWRVQYIHLYPQEQYSWSN